eukprot:GFUD01006972.1.p1 GENE.GFUD01006972.1~~GFUD01006972.1.p1  ORF type:complete len:223 (+),score=52.61 GFUD01006972.1:135-803(+)
MFRSLLSVTLQLAGVVSFAWAIHYQYFRIKMPANMSPERMKFGGVWKYLTFLNMILQFVFFSIALLTNFTKSLTKVRDLMFASAAFPMGMFVGVIFWSLWAVDRELVFPARYDEYIPSLVNHLMHTTVIPLQLGQLMLVKHKYPSRAFGYTITATLCMAYLAWVNIIYYFGGFWVYPVFAVLSPVQRVGFMVVCSALGGLLYLGGELANKIIWGTKGGKKKQ